jgi:hypothetical protein
MTVAGFTTNNSPAHRDQTRRRKTLNILSHELNLGRGFLRLSTETC